MKKYSFYFLLLLGVFSLSFTACSDSDEEETIPNPTPEVQDKGFEVSFSCQLPEEVQEGNLTEVKLTLKDVNTGKVQTFTPEVEDSLYKVKVAKGLYDVDLEATLNYPYEEKMLTAQVHAYKQAIEVLANLPKVELSLFIENRQSGLVLAEIFFAGSQTPRGSQYFADKYFIIYNNSDQVQYADSMAIAESQFLTVSKSDYEPNIMDKAMAVQALYMIPGDGTSHPLKPGESLLICDNAIDHTRANRNSFDLRKADFEWADESTNPNVSDVNNPKVPDLTKIYSSTATVWSPHNRGFTSFALVKMQTDTEDFLANYTYDYSYIVVGQTGQLPMTGSCYQVPNAWIADAVNLSVESLFQWIVVDPSLDRGWSHCGKIDFDMSRYGKSVRRKVVSRTDDGRAILKDTNNSTVDFDAEQVADPYHKF